MATEPTAIIDDLDVETSFITFAEEILGLSLYDWQCDALEPFDHASERMTMVSLATPNGSGKSAVVITTLVLGWLAMYPKGRVVLTTADGKQLDGQVMPAIESHRGKFPAWKFIERHVSTPTGGQFVAFTTDQAGRAEGWHKLDDIEGPLLFICDEAKSVPEDIFDAIDRCTFNGLLLASSPGRMSGTFYESQVNDQHGFIRISVGLKDCPHIGQDKIDRIIARHGANSTFTRSALHGEFLESFDGKPVYYAYDQDVHEQDDLPWPKGAYLWRGHDVGTHAATVWSAYWIENGLEYWHDLFEFYADGFDTDRHAREVIRITENEFPFWNDRTICAGVHDAIDPAAANSSYTRQINVNGKNVAESALNIFRTYNINPVYRTKARGLLETIAIVNRMMERRDAKGRPIFKVDPKGCPRLVRGYRGGYRWPPSDQKGGMADTPLKGLACDNLDHCFVSGTLILTARGEIPVEQIKEGDQVFTRAGLRPVIFTSNRVARVKTYQFSNGIKLEGTPEHPIWNATRYDWINLADFRIGDSISKCNPIQKLLSSAGGSIAGILNQSAEVIASISNAADVICTMMFGKNTMALGRRDCTFTTRTKTQEITLSKTSCRSHQNNTTELAVHTIARSEEPRQENQSSWPLPRLQSGTLLQRDSSGTPNTPDDSDSGEWWKQKWTATNAENTSSYPPRKEQQSAPDSVQTPVNLRGVAILAWTMWTRFASFVARLTGPANTHERKPVLINAEEFCSVALEKVSSEDRESRVYNLTVEGLPEYYANGILVHNCNDAARYSKINAMSMLRNEIEKASAPVGFRYKRRNINPVAR